MKKFLAAIYAGGVLVTGCGENPQAPQAAPKPSPEIKEVAPVKKSVTIQINGKTFQATLEDKRSARAFAELLPLEVDASELNGNEKYFYLAEDLPTDSVRVMQIRAGDLMLYETNCVVLFYKDFTTNYNYTRLGRLELDDPGDLAEAVGDANVHIIFKE